MSDLIRVATYNIHKGVRGMGPLRRLEIHNLREAIATLDADFVCLQEVCKVQHNGTRYFKSEWPEDPQADFLAPKGYEVIYRSNAFTKVGEHGNALLSRWPVHSHGHEDISDHRFEQRGLLHVCVHPPNLKQPVHLIVVHLGLISSSRLRQISRLADFIEREVPKDAPLLVGGDFNDWGAQLRHAMKELGLFTYTQQRMPTFPSSLPLTQLDYVYARGFEPTKVEVPRGPLWRRLSDHLPLIAEFSLGSKSKA